MSVRLPEISLHQIPTTDLKPTIKTEVRKQCEREWSSIRPAQNKLRAIKDTTKDWNPCYPERRGLEIIPPNRTHSPHLYCHLMERRTNECEYCIDTRSHHVTWQDSYISDEPPPHCQTSLEKAAKPKR